MPSFSTVPRCKEKHPATSCWFRPLQRASQRCPVLLTHIVGLRCQHPLRQQNLLLYYLVRSYVLFHFTVQKWRKSCWHNANLFQINMQIISECSTPTCVLDPCKIRIAVLRFLTTLQSFLKARMRHYPSSMSLKPSVFKSFCSICISFWSINSASS